VAGDADDGVVGLRDADADQPLALVVEEACAGRVSSMAASATAAFVVTSKNIKNGPNRDGRISAKQSG
jgi:hypothetical protein